MVSGGVWGGSAPLIEVGREGRGDTHPSLSIYPSRMEPPPTALQLSAFYRLVGKCLVTVLLNTLLLY